MSFDPEFSSMSTKQWLQVEVDNEIVMYLLSLSFISNLDFKPLFALDANSGIRVYCFQK